MTIKTEAYMVKDGRAVPTEYVSYKNWPRDVQPLEKIWDSSIGDWA